MGSSVFTIALSGLNAANMGLSTAGHNIANANTDGYSRQQIKQSAPYPALTGSGYVGLGTRVDTVTRSYDQFLTQQVQTTQAKSSYYDTYLSHISEIDNLVADSSAGVSPVMQSYFSAVQNVATNPSNLPARQALLSSAQTLVNRFQSVNQVLSDQRSALNGEISSAVANINTIAKQIADINGQIVLSSGSGQTPNDLLDQRDQMLKELNTLVKASTTTQSNGSINVFIGSGQNLVVGEQTFTLDAVSSPDDPQNLTVVYKQNGNTVYLPENALNGGELGALLEFRSGSLDLAQNSLGEVAMGLAEMFNAQQRAGMDLDGNMGQNLFDYSRQGALDIALNGATINVTSQSNSIPTSDFSLAYDGANYILTRLSDESTQTITPAQMTAGYTALGVTLQRTAGAPVGAATTSWSFPPDVGSIVPSSRNNAASTGAVDGYVSDVGQLTTSNYELQYDGANYILTRLSDSEKTVFSAATVAAGPVSHDGMTFSIGGSWAAGDQFSIKPYEGFINSLSVKMTDPRDVAAASPIRLTSSSSNTGSATLTQPTVDTPTTTTTSTVNTALKNPVNIAFTSTTSFNVTDTVTGVTTAHAYTAGMTLNVNGWSLKITGQPASGDTFSIGDNVSGSADGSNALKLAALQTTKLLSGGTATFGESYSQMVSAIGTQTSEVETMSDAQATMLEQAETARDSVSGVNLDEEAASLLRYQQAYIAASKLIQIAQKAFEEIANIV